MKLKQRVQNQKLYLTYIVSQNGSIANYNLYFTLFVLIINQTIRSLMETFDPTKDQNDIINRFINSDEHRMVYATPGCGKTFLAVNLAQRLTQKGINQKDIILLTFNRNNRMDFKNQFEYLFGLKKWEEIPYILTIDSFAKKASSYKSSTIVDENLQKKQIQKFINQNKASYCEQLQIQISDLKIDRSLPKNMPQIMSKQLDDVELAKKVYKMIMEKLCLRLSQNEFYEKYKFMKDKKNKKLSALDRFLLKCFGDYLQKINDRQNKNFPQITQLAINKLSSYKDQVEIERPECKCKYIIIDEFQDCCKLQLDMFLALNHVKKRKFMFLGDPDQNIYEWRYANQQNIENFLTQLQNKSHSIIKRENLAVTYRLKPKIKNLALHLINAEDNYKLKRQNRRKKMEKSYCNDDEITCKEDSNVQLTLQQYSSQFSEIASIIDRCYKSKKQEGIRYSQMTVLLRSVRIPSFSSFIKRLIFFGKQFDEPVPFFLVGSSSIYKDKQCKFIIALFRYYHYIYNQSFLDEKSKTQIIRTIINKIRYFNIKGQIASMILQQKTMKPILDPDQLDRNLKKYPRRNLNRQTNLKNFSLKVNQFIEMCNEGKSPLQVTNYIINSFYPRQYNQEHELMKLQYNNFIEEFKQLAQVSNQNSIKSFINDTVNRTDDGDFLVKPEKILISTIHQSKGRTFKKVFMPALNGNFEGCDDEGLAYYDPNQSSLILRRNQELRLHYTGITRSKGALHLSRSNEDTSFLYRLQPRRQFLYLKNYMVVDKPSQPKAQQMKMKWDMRKSKTQKSQRMNKKQNEKTKQQPQCKKQRKNLKKQLKNLKRQVISQEMMQRDEEKSPINVEIKIQKNEAEQDVEEQQNDRYISNREQDRQQIKSKQSNKKKTEKQQKQQQKKKRKAKKQEQQKKQLKLDIFLNTKPKNSK